MRTSRILLTTLFLAACSDDPGTEPAVRDAGTRDGGGTRDAGAVVDGVVRATIGPQGGRIVSSDARFEIVVPAGALDADTELTFAARTAEDVPLAANAIGPIVTLGPAGLEFDLPVTLRFTLDSAPPSDRIVVVQTLSEGAAAPVVESGTNVDGTEAVTLTTHFTSFWPELALAADPNPVAIERVDPGAEAADSSPQMRAFVASDPMPSIAGTVAGATSGLVVVVPPENGALRSAEIVAGAFSVAIDARGEPGTYEVIAAQGRATVEVRCGPGCEEAPTGGVQVLPNEEGQYVIDTDPALYPEASAFLCTSAVSAGIRGDETEDVTVPFSTDGTTNVIELPCGRAAAPDAVIELTPSDSPARLRLTLPPNFAASVYFGPSCDVTQARCQDAAALERRNGLIGLAVTPEIRTFLVIESARVTNDTGSFTMNVEVTPFVCPADLPTINDGRAKRCDANGQLMQCNGEVEIVVGECPHGCHRNFCNGDTCATAISVLEFPYTFQSNPFPLFGDDTWFENADLATCGIQRAQTGDDVMFRLPNLVAGQRVTVDASADVGDFAPGNVLIKSTCEDDGVCLANSGIFEKIEDWVVPADGDYFVIVERILSDTDQIVVVIDVSG